MEKIISEIPTIFASLAAAHAVSITVLSPSVSPILIMPSYPIRYS